MNRKFEEICEATLWDNLKRKANITLRKIEAIENSQKRLEVFTKPRFLEIQKLLLNIGKEFFRIFLFKAIKQGLAEGATIEDTVKDFQFYFWPGYITLKGQRIFIEGKQKSGSKQFCYFTGIGNSKISYSNTESIVEYLLNSRNEPFRITSSPNFWIKDIPCTLAFDSLMNQFYLDKDAEKYGNRFVSGSTHSWKSSQNKTSIGLDEFIPMPLVKDKSELRILEIKLKDFNSKSSIWNGNNTITIDLSLGQLHEAGSIIADHLSSEKIPINFKGIDRDFYNPWPRITSNIIGVNKDNKLRLYKLQELAYSFWISETMGIANKEKDNKNYAYIREAFNQEGYNYLSNRINTFNAQKDYDENLNSFSELYYKHWYTLFLESYGDSVDLGTSMILSNHRYEPEFLMKSSHWVRWIYNELRLIEAKAFEELTTEQNDVRKLSHHLNTNITALKYWIKKKVKPNINITDFETTDYLVGNISSYVYVSTNINDQYQLNKTKVDLKNEINNTLKIFKILTLNIEIFNKVFRLGLPNIEIFKNYKNLSFIKCKLSKNIIFTDLDLVKLLLKDLFENLIKHSKYGEPNCRIEIFKNKDGLYLLILNTNWPTNETLEIMRNNHFDSARTGWRNINKLIKLLNWEIQIPKTSSETLFDDYFWIKIKIQ